MGVPVFRGASVLVAAAATIAALTGPAAARPCADCMDPDLPGPGGPSCPTISATTEPTITTVGPYQVGKALVGSRGMWTNAASYQVRWFADGEPVTATQTTGAVNVQYTPTAADLGKALRLRVTAVGSNSACTTTEYTDPTTTVQSGVAPSPTVAPSATGERRVGVELRAVTGSWTPTPDGYHVVWRRGGTILGTGATYTPTAADQGSVLSMQVRATRSGHSTGETTVGLGTIQLGSAPQVVTAPTASGSPRFGAELKVTEGEWSLAPQSVAYQWLRDGAVIPGATGAAYRPVAADLGRRLAVSVQAVVAGHAAGVTRVEIGLVARAAAPRWTGAKPRLKGRNKVGKKVRSALGAAALRRAAQAPDATVSFQWLRNGQVLRGETKRAHRLVKRDKGKRLTVRVTLVRPGHDPLVLTSRVVRVRDNGRPIR